MIAVQFTRPTNGPTRPTNGSTRPADGPTNLQYSHTCRVPLGVSTFNAVLGQLARWFYPSGSGAHCNNNYYYYYYYYLQVRLTAQPPKREPGACRSYQPIAMPRAP